MDGQGRRRKGKAENFGDFQERGKAVGGGEGGGVARMKKAASERKRLMTECHWIKPG